MAKEEISLNLRSLIWVIYVTVFLDSVGLSACAPIYPDEAKDRGISEFVVGCIFSVNPLATAIFSFLVGKRLDSHRKILIIIGIILSMIGFAGFAFLDKFTYQEKDLFITFSVLTRYICHHTHFFFLKKKKKRKNLTD